MSKERVCQCPNGLNFISTVLALAIMVGICICVNALTG